MAPSRLHSCEFRKRAGQADRHFKGFVRFAFVVRVAKQTTIFLNYIELP